MRRTLLRAILVSGLLVAGTVSGQVSRPVAESAFDGESAPQKTTVEDSGTESRGREPQTETTSGDTTPSHPDSGTDTGTLADAEIKPDTPAADTTDPPTTTESLSEPVKPETEVPPLKQEKPANKPVAGTGANLIPPSQPKRIISYIAEIRLAPVFTSSEFAGSGLQAEAGAGITLTRGSHTYLAGLNAMAGIASGGSGTITGQDRDGTPFDVTLASGSSFTRFGYGAFAGYERPLNPSWQVGSRLGVEWHNFITGNATFVTGTSIRFGIYTLWQNNFLRRYSDRLQILMGAGVRSYSLDSITGDVAISSITNSESTDFLLEAGLRYRF